MSEATQDKIQFVNQVVERQTQVVKVEDQSWKHSYEYALAEYVRNYPGSEGATACIQSMANQYHSSLGTRDEKC